MIYKMIMSNKFPYKTLLTVVLLLGQGYLPESEASQTPLTQQELCLPPLKELDSVDAYTSFYGKVVPQLGSDPVSEHLRQRSEEFQNQKWQPYFYWSSWVATPLSYLKVLNRIGSLARQEIYQLSMLDLASAQIKTAPRKLSNGYDAVYMPVMENGLKPFVNLPPLSALMVDIVHRHWLQRAGFERPVCFCGFIPHDVANPIAKTSLFVDDDFCSKLPEHGKYSHILQVANLIEHAGLTTKDMSYIIDEDLWPGLFDREPRGDGGSLQISLPADSSCLNTGTPTIATSEIFDLRRPFDLTEMIYQHDFSKLAKQLAASNSGKKLLTDSGFPNEEITNELIDNLQAFENLVLLDLLQDSNTYLELFDYDDLSHDLEILEIERHSFLLKIILPSIHLFLFITGNKPYGETGRQYLESEHINQTLTINTPYIDKINRMFSHLTASSYAGGFTRNNNVFLPARWRYIIKMGLHSQMKTDNHIIYQPPYWQHFTGE